MREHITLKKGMYMHHKKALHHMKKAMDHMMKHHDGMEHSEEKHVKKASHKTHPKKHHSRRSRRGM